MSPEICLNQKHDKEQDKVFYRQTAPTKAWS